MIERDQSIKFHEQGTLDAVTRWIGSHEDGIAEWLKNARSAYQANRANVSDEHSTAILLLQDKAGAIFDARIGLLDVGGATLEDVTQWSTWQDPEASTRAVGADEGNQGNGGKAYMYRMFQGAARIFGLTDNVRNCKGFVGPARTVERGTPGFIPNNTAGREVPVSSWKAELNDLLKPYGLEFDRLPNKLRDALTARKAFTLVEGIDPVGLYKGRMDLEDLIYKVLRHEQSTLAVEQLEIYVSHNGQMAYGGKPLALETIEPYPEFETPLTYVIPDILNGESGNPVSTTKDGILGRGRLILQTSRHNMPRAHKNLRPRWKMSYRAGSQMIGAKPISDLVPNTPGSYFIYGRVELPALTPDYVDHGRRRPKDGPLMEAVDAFVIEKLRKLANDVMAKRAHELDEKALDEVHLENKVLDNFKNQFLPQNSPSNGREDGSGGSGSSGGPGGIAPNPVPSPTSSSSCSMEISFRLVRVSS